MSEDIRNWAWKKEEESEIENFARGYIDFLSRCKTEREVARWIENEAKKHGFVDISHKDRLVVGDKVYHIYNEKMVILAVIGNEELEKGIRAIFAHSDAPRLDLKPVPLEESEEMVFLATQYYGGIINYQWASIPLAIHGVVITKNGQKVELVIGESENEPVFTIPDLLPHLSGERLEKRSASEALTGEELKVLLANKPSKKEEKEKSESKSEEKEKLSVMETVKKLLKEKYNIEPKDFISADIEIVPAFKAMEVGLDRSMIGGYGQDDRICVFSAVKALFDLREPPTKTVVVGVLDREEIGSVGNAAAQSRLFEQFLREIIMKTRGDFNEYILGKLLENAQGISGDVNSVYDPIFTSVHDSKNSARLGKGVVITKYTGRRGKGGASEAHAEYTGWIVRLLEKAGVSWQPGTIGRVDAGGGGTVALFFANRGMNIIDIGPGLLAMHSPFEVCSKADLYATWKAYKCFLEAKE
ncbi:MAG: aminopeptidase [Candidatus Korarchaeota archaeon]